MNNCTQSLRLGFVPGLFIACAVLAIFATQVDAQSLGSAENFAVLGAATVTNGGASQISGDVGVSPGTAITGFPPGIITNGALRPGNAIATQAHADFSTAYADFAGLSSPPANNLSGTDLGGLTLTPGVYRYDTSANSAGALTLDAQNDPNARFVIQIGTTLITSSSSSVVLINGADARNVYFQVGTSATLGAGSSFIGNILAYASITAVSGTTLTGRLLALTAAVTLDTNNVTNPGLSATPTPTPPPPTPTPTPTPTPIPTPEPPTPTPEPPTPTPTPTPEPPTPTPTPTPEPPTPTPTPTPEPPTPTPAPPTPTPTPTPEPTPTPTPTPEPPTPTPTPTPAPPTPTPTPTPEPTPTPTPTPEPPTPTPTPTPEPPTPTPTPTQTPILAHLLNISARLKVQTGDNVLIGGFIITGAASKTVIIRAIGPSLPANIPGRLADPTLELHGPNNLLITNDNWKDTQQTEIRNSGFAPGDDLESAIFTALPPGAYTAIVKDKNGTTGVGLVEIYDLDAASESKLGNISSRGFVQTGDDVMIVGFILGHGTATGKVIIRAIGPSLSGIANVLVDPTLELHDGNGTLLASNDNWKDDPSQKTLIMATHLAPASDLESAIVTTLPPGQYTAIIAGKNGGIGVAVAEVYHLP